MPLNQLKFILSKDKNELIINDAGILFRKQI
jgi:hypothetical protein